MNLPAELKRYQRNQILKRLGVCLGFEIVAVLFLVFFGDKVIVSSKNDLNTVIKAAILVVPFAVTRIPFSLIGRSYYGKVVKVEVQTALKKTFKGVRHSVPVSVNTAYLHIQKDDGGGAYEKIYEELANDRCDFEHYREGDRVFKLARGKYIIVLPHGVDTRPLCCAVCGSANKREDEVCHRCGLPLVKDVEY